MSTIATATRSQKINFINAQIRFGDKKKKMPKAVLKDWSDERINGICEKYAESFQQFLDNPPAKLEKFIAEVTDENGKDYTMEGKFPNIDDFKKSLIADKYKVGKVVPARGHHICMYCGSIADGSQKDILCEECQMTFGHYSYNQL